MTDFLVVRIIVTLYTNSALSLAQLTHLKQRMVEQTMAGSDPTKQSLQSVFKDLATEDWVSNTFWSAHSTHPLTFICIPSLPLQLS